MKGFTRSYQLESPALLGSGPLFLAQLSLATSSDVRDNLRMTSTLDILLLLTASFHVLTFAAIRCTDFPHSDTPLAVMMTVLCLYVLCTLAPLVVLPHCL